LGYQITDELIFKRAGISGENPISSVPPKRPGKMVLMRTITGWLW
jgi:hypothetical protein